MPSDPIEVTPSPKRFAPAAVSINSPIRFETVPASETGINFLYYGNPNPEHYMTEQNGGGVALFDFEGDGRLDVFLVNGSHFDQPAEEAGATNCLFRQTGDWRFTDVTSASGLEAYGFGQGCAVGDYDNDGFADVFVAYYGRSRLWRNNGDGTFSDFTEASGIAENRWATSAAFADLDDDGNQELYVVNYVDWTPAHVSHKRIPSPMDFNGLPDHLYKNLGDGTFSEVGAEAGVSIAGEGKGLALAIADFNGDRRPDIYIANDTTGNSLFLNQGMLKFADRSIANGCAVSEDGSIGSSMGVAIGDYNRDGYADLFVTNFSEEMLDAFTGSGDGQFLANNKKLGIDLVARRPLKFGIILSDFDADEWPDLFVANGHLWDDPSPGWRYKMPASLLRNNGGKRFVDASMGAGDYFQHQWLGRAVARGDIDNDGDSDLVITHLMDDAAFLRNVSDRQGNVLSLRLIGTHAARQPLGIRAEVVVGTKRTVAYLPAGESFQASHDGRLLIPIGSASLADEIRVEWTEDRVETWSKLVSGREWVLIEGKSHVFSVQEGNR
ncbi:MAG: CRTAC1 family protein [Planctomycetaceae bacterium]|nr:CRTAC1 family protein [Planctomycetaceae bacterium]